ncbi:hypothetical protein D0Y65_047024 [Glycine soja]|uniref:Uncharacterized protein n=1 Tax=Glycine soja TaxID=3848 RepID=A0A445GBZ6_GLYSO|nr:hypothetical protein D0Y65_047024 [Glycine soja]
MAEWSKAPDSSSGLRERAWVQIPLLTLFVVSSNNSTTSHILMFYQLCQAKDETRGKGLKDHRCLTLLGQVYRFCWRLKRASLNSNIMHE